MPRRPVQTGAPGLQLAQLFGLKGGVKLDVDETIVPVVVVEQFGSPSRPIFAATVDIPANAGFISYAWVDLINANARMIEWSASQAVTGGLEFEFGIRDPAVGITPNIIGDAYHINAPGTVEPTPSKYNAVGANNGITPGGGTYISRVNNMPGEVVKQTFGGSLYFGRDFGPIGGGGQQLARIPVVSGNTGAALRATFVYEIVDVSSTPRQ